MTNYLLQLMPIIFPFAGGGDPDYALGGYIWLNFLLIMCSLARGFVLRKKIPFYKSVFMWDNENESFGSGILKIFFITLNVLALSVFGATYVTDHFIK
jgi:hypothetical protein